MKFVISPQPFLPTETQRIITIIDIVIGLDRDPRIELLWERAVFESDAENAKELILYRKTDRLIATNKVKVNNMGQIDPNGEFGEYSFFMNLLARGGVLRGILDAVIKQADENHRFD